MLSILSLFEQSKVVLNIFSPWILVLRCRECERRFKIAIFKVSKASKLSSKPPICKDEVITEQISVHAACTDFTASGWSPHKHILRIFALWECHLTRRFCVSAIAFFPFHLPWHEPDTPTLALLLGNYSFQSSDGAAYVMTDEVAIWTHNIQLKTQTYQPIIH